MRFIPTRIHGILDYATSALLIATPWLFGFARVGASLTSERAPSRHTRPRTA